MLTSVNNVNFTVFGGDISINSETELSQSEVIDAVMASGALGVSKHQILLFKYLLNSKYNNSLESIKAYSIAVDIFGRRADFDSSVDSIVRVEMFRLRANLKAFNQDAEKFHLILPKASYEIQIKPLVIHEKDNTQLSAESNKIVLNKKGSRLWKLFALFAVISSVAVSAFIAGGGKSNWRETSDCSNVLPNVAIVNNSEMTELGAYIGEVLKSTASQYTHLNIVNDIESCRYTDVPGYEIQHKLFQSGNAFRSTFSAISDNTKKTVVSQNFSGELTGDSLSFDASNDDLYFKIVRATNDWLRPHGIIHKTAVIASWEDKEKQKDYSCVATMYDSFISDSDETYQDSMDCYLESYARKTPLLDNLGGLAANYLEQALGVRAHTVEDPFSVAAEIMEEVGDNWPKGVETTVAKIMLEADREDFNAQRLRNTLYRAEKIYDSHSVILGEVSKHYGFKLGDWDDAKRISARIKKVTSERDNSTYLIDASYALIFELPETVLKTCQKAYSENSRIATMLVNACSIKASNAVWINRTQANLKRLSLGEPEERIDFLNELNWHETFTGAVIENQ